MDEFREYIHDLNLFSIIDAVFILAIATILLLFFKRRNSIRLAILYAVYALIYLAVLFVSTIADGTILLVTREILHFGWYFLIVTFCVVYQQDLKSMWGKLGKLSDAKYGDHFAGTSDDLRVAANEIVKACQAMSKNDIGALIVIVPSNIPRHILDTGTILNAEVSSGLLQSIFNTKAPLHDGAVIIKENRVLAAGCFLPLSQRTDIDKELGTRHRAAIGITEESDVIAIVVSEETGVISTVVGGQLHRYMTPETLHKQLENIFGINYSSGKKKRGQ